MQRFMGPPLGPVPLQPAMYSAANFMQQAPMFSGAAGSMAPYAGQAGGIARGLGGLSAAGRGGGLLGRLFGGGGSQALGGQMAGGLGRAAAGASGTMNFTTILQNTQRVLGLTQQVVPMVQQYGPLIRNMPAIWRIMRSNDTANPSAQQAVDIPTNLAPENIQTQTQPAVNLPVNSSIPNVSNAVPRRSTRPRPINHTTQGLPAPKLYI